MNDLRPVSEAIFAEIGDLLVSVQVDADESAGQLRAEYDDVLDDLRAGEPPTLALMRMSWIALRAVERCRRLEGSDAAAAGCGALRAGGLGSDVRDAAVAPPPAAQGARSPRAPAA